MFGKSQAPRVRDERVIGSPAITGQHQGLSTQDSRPSRSRWLRHLVVLAVLPVLGVLGVEAPAHADVWHQSSSPGNLSAYNGVFFSDARYCGLPASLPTIQAMDFMAGRSAAYSGTQYVTETFEAFESVGGTLYEVGSPQVVTEKFIATQPTRTFNSLAISIPTGTWTTAGIVVQWVAATGVVLGTKVIQPVQSDWSTATGFGAQSSTTYNGYGWLAVC